MARDRNVGAEPAQHSVVLASASPRRRDLLAALGLAFTLDSPDVDETILHGESPGEATVRLARAKAAAATAGGLDALVLAADTIVTVDGEILGKPVDAADATAMLRKLRGRSHTVITGVAVLDRPTARVVTAAPATTVTMRAYSDVDIAATIAQGTPFDKAGAYAVQDAEFAPAARVEGCYCNVVGLPLWTARALLLSLGPTLAPAPPDRARSVCRECPLHD